MKLSMSCMKNCKVRTYSYNGQLKMHSIIVDIYPVYQKGQEHDVHEFFLSAIDYMDRELRV
jgi:hypothetical protein